MHNDCSIIIYKRVIFRSKKIQFHTEFKEHFLPVSFLQRQQSIYTYIFLFLLIFIPASSRNVNGKSLCRKQSFCPAFQAATFVPLFLGLTVIRRYDDRYVNRCFADFRPGFSPHRVPVSRARRAISTRRNEALGGNMHFPENCKSDPRVSHSSPYVCLREIRPSIRQFFSFFFF